MHPTRVSSVKFKVKRVNNTLIMVNTFLSVNQMRLFSVGSRSGGTKENMPVVTRLLKVGAATRETSYVAIPRRWNFRPRLQTAPLTKTQSSPKYPISSTALHACYKHGSRILLLEGCCLPAHTVGDRSIELPGRHTWWCTASVVCSCSLQQVDHNERDWTCPIACDPLQCGWMEDKQKDLSTEHYD